MDLQKVKPGRSKRYMEFIREQPCCLTGMVSNDFQTVDPHHEPMPGASTVGSKACDSRCVPVAHGIHLKMHSPGNSRKSIWEHYGVDPEDVIERMRSEWIKNGGLKFW